MGYLSRYKVGRESKAGMVSERERKVKCENLPSMMFGSEMVYHEKWVYG